MQITIDIDKELLAEAQTLTKTQTVDETIEQALKLMIQMCNQQNIRESRGKLEWQDDAENTF